MVQLLSAANAEVINYVKNIEVFRGKLFVEETVDIQINNREGEEFTEVSIPYSKSEPISSLSACIMVNGQVIKKLAKSDVVTKSYISDGSLYEDDFVKEFTLKHNTYPYVLSYSYKTQYNSFLYIDYWSPVIDYDIPTSKASLTVKVPEGYFIEFKDQMIDRFNVDSTAGSKIYTWEATYIKQVIKELYSPEKSQFIPWVKIKPSLFAYELWVI